MGTTAEKKLDTTTTEIDGGALLEELLAQAHAEGKDTRSLKPTDRRDVLVGLARKLGLNPMSNAVMFLLTNGRETLYVTKQGTDQIAAAAKLRRETIKGPEVQVIEGRKVVFCQVRATHPDGRSEVSTATLALQDVVNDLMKCETKAKRRATLSVCGLGLLAEDEIETIPGAQRVPMPTAETAPSSETAAPTGEHAAATTDAPASAEPSGEHAELLAAVHEQIANLELPGPAVKLWIAARPDLAKCTVTEREAVWKALCAQTEKVGKMKNAKVWLKKAIAEEDARDSFNHPPDDGGGTNGGGGAPRPSTPSVQGSGAATTGTSANATAMLEQYREHIHGKSRNTRDHTQELSAIAGSYLKRRAMFEHAGVRVRALNITRAELRARGCEEPDALLHGVSQRVYGRAV